MKCYLFQTQQSLRSQCLLPEARSVEDTLRLFRLLLPQRNCLLRTILSEQLHTHRVISERDNFKSRFFLLARNGLRSSIASYSPSSLIKTVALAVETVTLGSTTSSVASKYSRPSAGTSSSVMRVTVLVDSP